MNTWPFKTFVLTESRNRSERPFVDWCIKMLEKYDHGASKDVYKIDQMLKRLKVIFWRCLNRSVKSATTSGLSAFLMINIRSFIIKPEIYRNPRILNKALDISDYFNMQKKLFLSI